MVTPERARVESRLSVDEQLDNIQRTLAQVLEGEKNGGAHFSIEDRRAIRRLMARQARNDDRWEWLCRWVKRIAGYFAAIALFFFTFGEYVKLFFTALKASFR